MPESPEVDSLGGFLRSHAVGRRVRTVDLVEFRALKTRDRPLRELVARTVSGVRRFGKHLVLDTDGPSLLVSFGRAGWALWSDGSDRDESAGPDAPPVIARIGFDDAELAVTDAGDWLSLGLSVVDDATMVPAIAKLGADPLSDAFTPEVLEGIVVGRRKRLKALLQEQESLAGIGNAYSDEILFAARLPPLVQAVALDEEERERLYAAIREVLGTAFEARRDVPPAELKAAKVAAMAVHGRAGEACPDCGGTVLDVPGSKGTAQYCPEHQTRGVPLPE
ncbi:Fpg/Nei family DNA glycosylase [Labedella populi]|uniref:Fpg/Nei family DNA glycosylase n=1 Tax=Labedella populi TaxID=2498850 RepID=A0A444QF43_9MICO|nr:DNA-formamidopyrimidine glycosylase family protein [Labedella populi]RWZ68140.1 Fpg/Nei family DNA glycosylase [Labedella populi]